MAPKQIAEMGAEHLQNTHFGAQLKAYILHQYHECVVTQPLILSSLRDFGVDISSGQISAILTENKEEFHAEKETLLSKGIELQKSYEQMTQVPNISSKMGFVTAFSFDSFSFHLFYYNFFKKSD